MDGKMMLLARVEAATGPDREIDAAIAVELQVMPSNAFAPCASPDPGTFGTGAYTSWRAPDYTASIDAALALVERKLKPEHPLMTIDVRGNIDSLHGDWWRAEIMWPSHERQGRGRTLPLAILAALLRALMGGK